MPYVFLSYSTKDKSVAGQIQKILSQEGIDTFMAHEDILVSQEWQQKILKEIGRADIFICLISENYKSSEYCVQESGIASYQEVMTRNDKTRKTMTIIPLSLDGTTPLGFTSHVQSGKIGQNGVHLGDLIPGFLKHDVTFGIDIAISALSRSRSYGDAEERFGYIFPYLEQITKPQIKKLMETCAKNRQIYEAYLCAKKYIPPLLASYGSLITPEDLEKLTKACALYVD